MVHHPQVRGRKRYGPDSTRERHDDRVVRRAIQHSKEESLRALAKRHGVNQKTVAKGADAALPEKSA